MVICNNTSCNKQAIYGLKLGDKILYCKTHKTIKMNDVKNKKCMCGKSQPIYGLEGDIKASCCKACKTDDMEDLKHKKCKCKKARPIFGLDSDIIPTCCKDCKTPEMINIVDKKCKCNKAIPTFGLENDTVPTCCKECKTSIMIDLKHKVKCKCGKARPSFGLDNDKIATCCNECKTSEMINIKDMDRKCKCGKVRPTFGLDFDEKATCCKECKTSEMNDIISKKCICKKARPNFGLENDKIPTCCKECKTNIMIDLTHKNFKCEFDGCDTRHNSRYDNYCAYHYGYLYPDKPMIKNFKTKERKVVDYVREKYPDFTWKFDRVVKNASSRRRPDIFLDLGYQIIIIEIDEFQHKQYDKICNNSRIMEISQDVGHRPIVFIRFNPDKYLDKNNKIIPSCFSITQKTGVLKINDDELWNKRLLRLKKTIDLWIIKQTDKTIETVELYYDGF